MTQELLELRQSILERRYDDALALVDELESMGKQAILRNIESFLVRLLIHLIKNQIEQRFTNSWIASISDSVIQIAKLNIKGNKTAYYIKSEDWQSYLEEAFTQAIRPASVEILDGQLKPKQLEKQIAKTELFNTAKQLLFLTYDTKIVKLPDCIDTVLMNLPGGEDWFEN
ncbi:DUF29 family protein [Lusitaniella coriacea LEGE 07157]|uniref:DUF29 family protein n=1 Tax=Lusitaniella coriacea LEGE 07157 TaxID=945747 RepID=A0A8J7AZB9_9CYAN|nr:DUF29 family protein [Lusitaniella coriacea]MBE9115469.1 DUF29 family protein [Lusitaniella coriacea LEGE 07157]